MYTLYYHPLPPRMAHHPTNTLPPYPTHPLHPTQPIPYPPSPKVPPLPSKPRGPNPPLLPSSGRIYPTDWILQISLLFLKELWQNDDECMNIDSLQHLSVSELWNCRNLRWNNEKNAQNALMCPIQCILWLPWIDKRDAVKIYDGARDLQCWTRVTTWIAWMEWVGARNDIADCNTFTGALSNCRIASQHFY